MQAQDVPMAYLFKLWPWVEANKNRIIGAAIIIVATGIVTWFYINQREEKEIAAGQALTQLMVSLPLNLTPSQLADLYLKVAREHPGTLAGQRALLQGAAALFAAGRFPDAQAQFQKYLNAHPADVFSAQAALGVATSLDAQPGKMDLAIGAYQRVVNGFSDKIAAVTAKFALARIDEQQGRLATAMNLYEDVARFNPNSLLGSEAGLRAAELKTKLPAVASPVFPAPPAKPKS
jgi:predicted negative regulator of RcsB-dependent stress response